MVYSAFSAAELCESGKFRIGLYLCICEGKALQISRSQNMKERVGTQYSPEKNSLTEHFDLRIKTNFTWQRNTGNRKIG